MPDASAVVPRAGAERRPVPGRPPAPSGEGVRSRESARTARAVADAIRAAAAPGSVPFVGVFDRVASTNDLLRAVAADGTAELLAGPAAAEGAGGPPAPSPVAAAAFASEQTAGRGQFGRRWVSPPGGFYLSLLVAAPRRARSAAQARSAAPAGGGFALLPAAAGLAAAEAVEAVAGLRVELRWPNDLDWNGGKLAGVLAETGFSAGPGPGPLLRNSRRRAAPPAAPAPELAIVGFGVNLAPVELRPGPGEPPPLRPPAHLPPSADPARLAGALTAAFRRAFGLAGADPAALAARWEERSPTARGARCRVRLRGGGSAEGWTDGLAGDGGLRVRLAAGGAAVVHASDAVSFAPATR